MNFALILFGLLVVTFVAWLIEKLVLKPGREKRASAEIAHFDESLAPALKSSHGEQAVQAQRHVLRTSRLRQPLWVEYTAGLFPVILIVFALRSFVVEPFKIPSGSMIPTLLIGDLILVNKFSYGVRLPIVHNKVLDLGGPDRGDVMVFRYPLNEADNYIKRVVGVPGDTVSYLNKRLKINGEFVKIAADGRYVDNEQLSEEPKYLESLGEKAHNILTDLEKPPDIRPREQFPMIENCRYSSDGVVCKVPDGHYFVLGDNRESSLDSRYWGFVPEQNIVGKAFFIWMNFSDIGRIGAFH